MTSTELAASPGEQNHSLATIKWGEQGLVLSNFNEAYRLAKCIHVSNLAPKQLDTPEKILVVILSGSELGMPPMRAMDAFGVINGRARMYGDAAMSLIRGRNVLEWKKEWFTGTPFQEDYTAHAQYKRRNDPEIHEAEFSVFDAKTAKLWGKLGRSGEPTPWVTFPKRMLMFRARTFAIRDGFADILGGIGIFEEHADSVTPEPESRRVIDQTNDANYCALKETLSGKCGCKTPDDNDEVVRLVSPYGGLDSIKGNESACGEVLKNLEGRHETVMANVEANRTDAV